MSFDQEITNALKTLREGGTILYPTDTVWGVGCDATNELVVEKVLQIKQREESKSMIILVSDVGMLNRFVKEIPALAWDLIEMSEKPITIIYDSPRGLAKNVLAADGSVGIRIVKDDFCQRMIHKFGKPIVSTSANFSGEPTPENFDAVAEEIKNKVDLVVDWRQDDISKTKPSSIIKLKTNGEFVIIRK